MGSQKPGEIITTYNNLNVPYWNPPPPPKPETDDEIKERLGKLSRIELVDKFHDHLTTLWSGGGEYGPSADWRKSREMKVVMHLLFDATE